ncbi:hypothetical protein L7F22_057534 [Adiantum nelumboides]|nr:hypothetical protein [Adiantum nelumboides]
MYGNCGDVECACKVFDGLSTRDDSSWKGFKPRGPTLLCVLNACADLGVLGYGRVIHDQVIKSGLCMDCLYVVLANAVIECYARCGIMEAHAMFHKLPTHNVVSWGALIEGYSHVGDPVSATQCLEAMGKEGMKLNEPLYTNVLAACRHSGLLEEACYHFMQMKDFLGITLSAEHYNCLVDLLCRSGNLSEAESVVKGMHLPPDIVTWRSLLTFFISCQNMEGSFQCFDKVSRLDPINGSAYALMSNIFTNTPDRTRMSNNTCTDSDMQNFELTQQHTERIKSQSLSCYQDHISAQRRWFIADGSKSLGAL